jgi:hypothetical protein
VNDGGLDTVLNLDDGDVFQMNGLLDQLLIAGTALEDLTSNTALPAAFSIVADAETNIIYDAGSGQIRIDVDGDGAFDANEDFVIDIGTGWAVTYNATLDVFTFS